jgi:hypothetical protein
MLIIASQAKGDVEILRYRSHVLGGRVVADVVPGIDGQLGDVRQHIRRCHGAEILLAVDVRCLSQSALDLQIAVTVQDHHGRTVHLELQSG